LYLYTWLTVYFDLCCFFPNYCFAAVVLIATNKVEYTCTNSHDADCAIIPWIL